MKLMRVLILASSFFWISSLSLGCNFCSSKPKGLSTDGPVQDPGSSAVSASAGGGVAAPGQNSNSRGSGSAFTYDLKNYKADGQRSNNDKWNSGDFFDNR
ncbi:MAG: hypothetical protein ACKN9V_01040 [Pseudomonadota bacterium]